MAKWSHDVMMDTGLNWIKTTSTRMSVCNAQPTTKAQANTTYALAYTTMATANFTLADGTTGRKVTAAQKSNVAVATTGTATHIALYAHPGTYLVYVTTCATQNLTSGNTVTIPAWAVTIGDPT